MLCCLSYLLFLHITCFLYIQCSTCSLSSLLFLYITCFLFSWQLTSGTYRVLSWLHNLLMHTLTKETLMGNLWFTCLLEFVDIICLWPTTLINIKSILRRRLCLFLFILHQSITFTMWIYFYGTIDLSFLLTICFNWVFYPTLLVCGGPFKFSFQ